MVRFTRILVCSDRSFILLVRGTHGGAGPRVCSLLLLMAISQLLQIVLLLTVMYVSFDSMYYLYNQEKNCFHLERWREMAKLGVLQKGSGAGSRTHESSFWLLYCQVLQLWANQFASVSLSFFICKRCNICRWLVLLPHGELWQQVRWWLWKKCAMQNTGCYFIKEEIK